MSQQLLDALRELRDGNVPDRPHGICHNVEVLLGRNVDLALYDLWKDWPHHSGCERCPVPDPLGRVDPHIKYQITDDLWGDNAYGALRRDLLNYAITKLSEELTRP